MSDTLIKVDGVSKKFCRSLKRSLWYGMLDIGRELTGRRYGGNGELRPKEFWAVDDVSFELKRGECLGLIGRNGAGKTTLLKMLNGLIKPDKGRIEMRGGVGALIALGAGFNPILTGRENIYVNASVLGLRKKEIDNKFDEIVDFAEIEEFIDSPVQTYSSGMQVRLGFAVATALEPDVLLLDEVLAVGDSAFRSKCFQKIGKLLHQCAVVFVSHDAIQMSRICDHCLYMKHGKMVLLDTSQKALSLYLNDNLPTRREQSIILHSSVKDFHCSLKKNQISWGESIEVTIDFILEKNVNTGLALITLRDGELPVVESDITKLLSRNSLKLEFSIGPLYLKEGSYNLAVTILDHSKKLTLVHALNCDIVKSLGPKGYGVFYQAACTIIEN